MNYIQYMKPGGNFGDKLKTGIKKFLKAAGEASRMVKDARINNPGAAMIRDAYAKGDEELAKLLTDEMQAANLTGIALGSGTAPLITGFTVAPVTTGVTLATGMAGGMAGMYGADKAINYFSDGKYTGWGNWINQATNGAIGENTAGFFHPGAIFGGLTTGTIGNKIVGVTNRGKLELLNSALNKNILATTLQPTVADEAVLRGQLGWAPKQTIPYRHGSLDPELKTFVPKHDRWDVVTHGADPYMYFVTDQSTPVSAANMMDRRAYQYTGNIIAEKPMVQIGEIKPAGVKNNSRNQLIARARQQGADTYIMQDIEDNQVPHLNIVARFIGPEGEAVQGGALLQTKTTPTKTSLAFFERLPAKISEAERLGIPKGIKYYTQEENLAFRDQINNFAKKYGYEPIGNEVTDPEVLERYARSLIKRHNTFYRGVELNPKEPNLSLEHMATHAPGGGAGELYITPYLSVAAMYGEPVEILRPYKLGADRTRWFDEGDFQIYTAGGRRDMHLWEDKKGIAAPWLRSEEFAGKTSWAYKPHVETELTGRNLQFIPMSVLYRHNGVYSLPIYRVGSLAVPNTPFYKSGGSIHIKKENKGKFTDYCGGKVTEECIRKGKNSSNPTTRKRANFAWVARHKFKHEEGGTINYLNIF